MEFYTCHAEGCEAIIGPLDTEPFPGYESVNFDNAGWTWNENGEAVCPEHSRQQGELIQLELL